MPRDGIELVGDVEVFEYVARSRSRDAASIPAANVIDVGAERLRILADYLDACPRATQFTLEGQWASSVNLNECGTTACACGLATTIPPFRAAGLRLVPDNSSPEAEPFLDFNGHRDWKAVTEFFGLDGYDAEYLFLDAHYEGNERNDPRAVADHIRRHLFDRAIADRAARDPQAKRIQRERRG